MPQGFITTPLNLPLQDSSAKSVNPVENNLQSILKTLHTNIQILNENISDLEVRLKPISKIAPIAYGETEDRCSASQNSPLYNELENLLDIIRSIDDKVYNIRLSVDL